MEAKLSFAEQNVHNLEANLTSAQREAAAAVRNAEAKVQAANASAVAERARVATAEAERTLLASQLKRVQSTLKEGKESHSGDFQWDPTWNSSIRNLRLSANGLAVTDASVMNPIRANKCFSAGKHVWRVKYGVGNHVKLGVVTSAASKSKQLAGDRLINSIYYFLTFNYYHFLF